MTMRVLSVGQCGFDDSRIGRLVQVACGAVLDRAYSASEAQKMMAEKQYSLILVNRVFDSDGESGVEFVRDQKAAGHATPMMLVSDYADAQQAAVDAGALPGFGKSRLAEPGVAAMLKEILSDSTRA